MRQGFPASDVLGQSGRFGPIPTSCSTRMGTGPAQDRSRDLATRRVRNIGQIVDVFSGRFEPVCYLVLVTDWAQGSARGVSVHADVSTARSSFADEVHRRVEARPDGLPDTSDPDGLVLGANASVGALETAVRVRDLIPHAFLHHCRLTA